MEARMSEITSDVATTDFLTLLTIQLKNQDPIDPVKQEDFIAQLSQFSMLEEIESMNSSFEEVLRVEQVNQGIELVGKNAEFIDVETGDQKVGFVEKLIADQENVELLINGERVGIDLVSGVLA
jgi:flagellar basal-body rod modification protein FlgD